MKRKFLRKLNLNKSNLQHESVTTGASKDTGITLIALVVTIFFSYDEYKKYSNNNSFLLVTI